MKYVACYCRVSTEEQVKFGYSIEAQKTALEKYCKENGYKYEFFIDEGVSASSMKKRNALKEILRKCSTFDMILFTKLDRFSRNVLDANNINKLLIDNKCTMKAIDEDDIDTSTADGTFIFNLKVSLAQRETGKTSERINFVFNNKREKGEVTSGTKKYGYDIINKHYEVNQLEAENIKNLYKYFVDVNGNIKKTYDYFIENFKGKGYDALKKYLRDTSYIGKYKLYRKDIYLENYIPSIVDIELWDSVQRLLKKKTINKVHMVDDIFSGLIYCYNCHHRMCKKVDNRCKNKIIRYACDNSYRYKPGTKIKKCTNPNIIREDYLEDYLLKNLDLYLKNYIQTTKIKRNTIPKGNDDKIKAIQNKMYKLKDLYLDNLIDKETYKNDYNKYKSQLKQLQEIPIKEEIKDFSRVEKILNSDYTTLYKKLSKTNKKKFLLTFIDKIYIEKGEVKEITFL